MKTYTLTTPFTAGSLSQPVTVSSLRVTSVTFSTTPPLAPLGSAQLDLVLTDPVSGWQETISYLDASVAAFFAQAAPAPATGETVEDVLATLVFGKLVADGKLPPGSLA